MRTGHRRLWPRILIGVLALLLVAGVIGYWRISPLLLTGTGYAAHNACAVGVLAHRTHPERDLPPNPLVPYLRTVTDEAGADANVLGVLATQRAWYAAGYGCTLADRPPSFPAALPLTTAGNPLADAATPVSSERLNAMLARAFGDDLDDPGKAALGTRAVVVVRDGRIVAERYASGFSAKTPQLGWSMAKSATNLLVGRLVQQGRIRLTDDHLRPEWNDERAKITVDQLLRMSSGLSWDETYDLGTPITEMLYLHGDMGKYVAGRPLAHPPGSYQQYSSGSTNLLCSVLTARTNLGPNLPREHLLGPLGMSSAVWEPDAVGTPVCSSYLWATPRDWAALGQFALADGVWNGKRLLPQGWMKASTTVVPTAGEEDGYAAGWWVNRRPDGTLVDPQLPADAFWANGHDGQRVFVVPSAKLVVVRLGFSPAAPDLRAAALVHDLVVGR